MCTTTLHGGSPHYVEASFWYHCIFMFNTYQLINCFLFLHLPSYDVSIIGLIKIIFLQLTIVFLKKKNQVLIIIVAVSRGYDTCFRKGLWWVMPTIKIYWFWLKHPRGFNRACGPLSDTLYKAGACMTFPTLKEVTRSRGQVLANSRNSFPPVPAFGSIWVVLWLLFFMEPVSGSPKSLDYTQKSARSTLALKLSVTTCFTNGWPPQLLKVILKATRWSL